MLHRAVEGELVSIGSSGRIVIEIDPALKQELYATLEKEGSHLKHWFLKNVEDYLREKSQFTLELRVPETETNQAVSR